MMVSFFLLFFLAAFSAYVAKQRGRDPLIWFMLGILLGIFSLILLFVLKPFENDQTGPKNKIEENAIPKYETLAEDRGEVSEENKEWFYLDQAHRQQGPIYFRELYTLWLDNKITSLTYVWSEGMADWQRINELPKIYKRIRS
ncbi:MULTISPECIES: DUF4339 domain-containing protein [unclassified Neochlamydia]|uniref:DUF4339 domain-containing protein n=1 Tax=unclassified Neochlamydia TaxID=2643326 RepID=UPI00140959D8|nr:MULTISPECIES: DUF4339 domain-containing protein [unclassified Neochlamydia]MBS4170803.1 Uncharacterized protein [Neochlamydia sp. AcF95]NGY95737.1 hypothetical protein [Neochlamydia sp. AcF84]